jgi:hypothetical protein
MLSVVMLCVFMLSVIMLSVVMLNVVKLSVVMLVVVMLNVVLPFQTTKNHFLSSTSMDQGRKKCSNFKRSKRSICSNEENFTSPGVELNKLNFLILFVS